MNTTKQRKLVDDTRNPYLRPYFSRSKFKLSRSRRQRKLQSKVSHGYFTRLSVAAVDSERDGYTEDVNCGVDVIARHTLSDTRRMTAREKATASRRRAFASPGVDRNAKTKNKKAATENSLSSSAISRAIDHLVGSYSGTVESHYLPVSESTPVSRPDSCAEKTVSFSCSASRQTLDVATNRFQENARILHEYFSARVLGKYADIVPNALVHKTGKDRQITFSSYQVPDSQSMTAEEIVASRKQPLTSAMLGGTSYSKKAFHSRKGPNLVVFLPKLAKPQLLVARNVLSRKAMAGMLVVANIHVRSSRGWMKGCMASGPVTKTGISRARNLGWPILGWGSSGENITSVQISSTSGSARCTYTNKQGKERSFQMGGFLDRETSEDGLKKYQVLAVLFGFEKYLPVLKCYFEEMRSVYRQLAPLMIDEDAGRIVTAEHGPASTLCTAANLVDCGFSRMHIHQDRPSLFPAAISGLNAAGKHRKWRGGELVLIEGGVIIEYGCRDVVLINGSQLHGVLPIRPGYRMHCATRFSLVHFSRATQADLKAAVPAMPLPTGLE